ncbi:MAG: hypothetical protein Q7V57_03925 [Actinomycetota bacterium]|nr:hypothetical protein [Actinomycetota bacterium]
MKTIRWVTAGLLFGAVMVGSGSPAAAQLEGECSGSGVWKDSDLAVDAESVGDELVTIPRKDTVDWQGSVSGPPGEYSGSIWIELPPPFGKVEIDNWGGTSDNNNNAGSEDYDLPKLVPAGVEFKVVGEHTDSNGHCEGYVRLEIEGGAFDSPIIWGALVLTALTGGPLALLLIAMVKSAVGAGIGGAR